MKETDKKYLIELGRSYPRRDLAFCEIVKLNSILNLPKGTEHFISDIHGEQAAFAHITRNASGVIRRKIEGIFANELTGDEIAELATFVYYPEEKLACFKEEGVDTEAWFFDNFPRLVRLCRTVSAKYTRKKTQMRTAAVASDYASIIDELINEDSDPAKIEYYKRIYSTIIRVGAGERFASALCSTIKALVVDRVHVVGDIFDRGARADLVIEELMRLPDVDIQWGNHDALWMGAAAGSEACIAAAIANSVAYRNLELIEGGYGISLRPLEQLAEADYEDPVAECYAPRGRSGSGIAGDDDRLLARIYKAISVIQFKLEGQLIRRNPDFLMEDRLLLEKIDRVRGTVLIDGKEYPLKDRCFPAPICGDPYALSDKERAVMDYLISAFMHSERLNRHISFLYERGGIYKICNGNLLFHGCVPLDENGALLGLTAAGGRHGRELMDFCDEASRIGYFGKEGSDERRKCRDFLWFLWCGRNSPLSARDKIATFERLLVDDTDVCREPRNPYYRCWHDEDTVKMILNEFGVHDAHSHIINGHIPVNKGENPVKANGRLIVIDGGFCSAYYGRTGIGGYTLIYNAEGMRISAHEPFIGREDAIKKNGDILSDTVIFERSKSMIRIRETDEGAEIRERVMDLMLLAKEYKSGRIKETGGG